VNKLLWPVLLSVAVALFVAVVWLGEREPAFRPADRALSELPMRLLDGAVTDTTRPTIILVWLPG
jgi:hypothetical protein